MFVVNSSPAVCLVLCCLSPLYHHRACLLVGSACLAKDDCHGNAVIVILLIGYEYTRYVIFAACVSAGATQLQLHCYFWHRRVVVGVVVVAGRRFLCSHKKKKNTNRTTEKVDAHSMRVVGVKHVRYCSMPICSTSVCAIWYRPYDMLEFSMCTTVPGMLDTELKVSVDRLAQ